MELAVRSSQTARLDALHSTVCHHCWNQVACEALSVYLFNLAVIAFIPFPSFLSHIVVSHATHSCVAWQSFFSARNLIDLMGYKFNNHRTHHNGKVTLCTIN